MFAPSTSSLILYLFDFPPLFEIREENADPALKTEFFFACGALQQMFSAVFSVSGGKQASVEVNKRQ